MLLESLKNLQRWTRAFAFWYFACAYLLTDWTTFRRNDFSFQSFLESDLLGLKHMMHASFVLGGVRALGSTGNRRYLEIVFAVTLLSSFPSMVSFILTMYHFFQSQDGIVTLSKCIQIIICFGMLIVTSFSAWYAGISIHYSEERYGDRMDKEKEEMLTWLGTKTTMIAVSSLRSRMEAAAVMFKRTVGNQSFQNWRSTSILGYRVLYFEVCFHLLTNIMFLKRRMHQYGQVPLLRLDETVGGLVESTSLALHWGFLLGNAFHGLRSFSPQCLDIFCWGKILLVGAQIVHWWGQSGIIGGGGGSGGGGGGGGGLGIKWAVAEVCMHVMTIIVIRRVRFSIDVDKAPQHETTYSCHKGTLSSREEHALSLWETVSRHVKETGSTNTFRWYWFGRSAHVFGTACFFTMCLQCSILVYFSKTYNDVVRTFGVGLNFAIHAAAMCMLALYRPTRDRFGYEHSRSFNIGVCFLFCSLFLWQIACAWSSAEDSDIVASV